MSYPPPQGQPGYPNNGPGYGYPPPQGGGYPGYPPPDQGYPPPGQPGYPPAGQPGYPPPGQPGYPPPGQPGYPPAGQPGYPPPGGYGPPPGGYQPPIVNQPTGDAMGYGYPPSDGYSNYPPSDGYSNYPPPQDGYFGYPSPEEGGWMNMPQGAANCPPGLEYLTMIDQLLVHQKVELLEALTGFETKNKFTIKNSLGQKVYYAVEDSDCCTRNCCGPLRPFDMKILDNFQNEIIHLNRPLACDSCCFPCCLQSMEVSAPPGNVIGKIEQEWSIFSPSFKIKNPNGDVVLRIDGPFCTMSICGSDVEFQVMSADGNTQVGKISKQWAGLVREMFTDADYFGITFPMDLDVRMKAVMLGACFLIDAMFFEKSRNQERDTPGMF